MTSADEEAFQFFAADGRILSKRLMRSSCWCCGGSKKKPCFHLRYCEYDLILLVLVTYREML